MFHLILKHRKKIFLILPCCLLVILISFLSGNAFWSSLHAESSDRQFRTFTRSLFQTEVSANTISLHYTLRSPSDYGIADIPATYGSLSSDPVAAKASVRNVLSSLQEFDPDTLSSENALTFKILDTYLKNASTGTDYLLYQEPLGPVSGIHTQLPVLLSEYSFYDTQDVETYLALLKETPSYFDSVIRFEQKKALPVFLCRITRLILFWTPASLLSIWVKRIIWSVHLTNESRHWIFYLKTKKILFRKKI